MKSMILVIAVAVILATAYAAQPTKMTLEGSVEGVTDGNIGMKISTLNDCSTGLVFDQNYENAIFENDFNILLGENADLNMNYNQDYWGCLYVNGILAGSPQKFRGGQGQIGIEDLNITDFNNFYVPYIDAIADINIGVYGLTANDFNTINFGMSGSFFGLNALGDSNFTNIGVSAGTYVNHLFAAGDITAMGILRTTEQVIIDGNPGGNAKVHLNADASENNNDRWKLIALDGGVFEFQNFVSGGFVDQFQLTPASPMTNASALLTGDLDVTNSMTFGDYADDMLIQKNVDGGDLSLTIRNTAGTGSSDESVSLLFETTTTGYEMATIKATRTGTYAPIFNRLSKLEFFTGGGSPQLVLTMTDQHYSIFENGVIINESSGSSGIFDFRVKSGNETHMLFVDASADEVQMGDFTVAADGSLAMDGGTASGNDSVALGNSTTASGNQSFAAGNTCTAIAASSFCLGNSITNYNANSVLMQDLNVLGEASIKAIYMQASDVSDQSFALTGTPYSIELDTIDENFGISRIEDGNIEILSTGVYYIAAQPQVTSAAGQSGIFNMWLQKDTGGGFADISNSNVQLSLGSLDEDVILLVALTSLNEDDKIRVRASVSNTNITLDTQSPAGEPVIPSIIFTMYKIGT